MGVEGPASCALSLTVGTWFERISMLVILLNCVTLGMFRPCEDIACDSQRCRILQVSILGSFSAVSFARDHEATGQGCRR